VNIVITGSQETAKALKLALFEHNVTLVSRSLGFDIRNVTDWCQNFAEHDCIINYAYDGFHQIQVLESFATMWKQHSEKIIINIGSMVIDHVRSEPSLDHKYWPYRLHKQGLQQAYAKLSKECLCQIKLLNPGPIDTPMIQHLSVPKLSLIEFSKLVVLLLENPVLRRLDAWQ
jgi:hypothetical protein